MHRPTQRHDALRERVFAGRQRQGASRRRAAVARKGGRRVLALGAGLAMVAGVITVTQLASSALEENPTGLGAACEEPEVTVEEVEGNEDLELHIEEEADGTKHYHWRKKRWGGGGDEEEPEPEPTASPVQCEDEGDGGDGGDGGSGDGGDGGDGGGTGDGGDGTGDGGDGTGDGGDGTGDGGDGRGVIPPGGADGNNNGLEILGRDCSESDLPLHEGFQAEDARCVETSAGEATALENNPSLLITDSPEWVEVDEVFTLTISTRNLLRDRFLGAGAGGYYLESSFLTDEGIQRGHFHVGCTILADGNVAPDPITLANPQFFGAVEDDGGGAGVSEVIIEIPGLPEAGLYRCMAWAGDPAHRVPMMTFARQHIAVDVVRITVTESTAE